MRKSISNSGNDRFEFAKRRNWRSTRFILPTILKKLQTNFVCFNAITFAVGFYEKLRYTKIGNSFEIIDVG